VTRSKGIRPRFALPSSQFGFFKAHLRYDTAFPPKSTHGFVLISFHFRFLDCVAFIRFIHFLPPD